MENKEFPFLETIYHLRTIEQLILYKKVMKVSAHEEAETIELLRDEYEKEQLGYPYKVPGFDESAALWASKIVYFSAQFLLIRGDTEKDLEKFLPAFGGTINASSMMSADLCLRFLPQILREFENIDPDDAIIPILVSHLKDFHYSNIGWEHTIDTIDMKILQDSCFRQLYLDRITERKDIQLSKIPEINKMLQGNFGNYAATFWKNFEPME